MHTVRKRFWFNTFWKNTCKVQCVTFSKKTWHTVLLVVASESINHFPPHLIFTYCTFRSISIAENDAFHVTVKLVNMPFNKDHILIKKICIYWKDTVHKSGRKNFQVSILISEIIRKRPSFYSSSEEYTMHNRLLLPGSVRSQLRWGWYMHLEARSFGIECTKNCEFRFQFIQVTWIKQATHFWDTW